MGHDYPLANNRILTQTGFEKKKERIYWVNMAEYRNLCWIKRSLSFPVFSIYSDFPHFGFVCWQAFWGLLDLQAFIVVI